MLSISAPIHSANYYLNLAQEDYYVRGGEPLGLWRGSVAPFLGLTGTVEKEALRALFEGRAPDGGLALVQNAGVPSRQSGWDFTFSAPKSVSVLWSQAPPAVSRSIQDAQQSAVDRALRYLEENAALTRRGKGGHRIEPTSVLFATFEHGTSRAQDPQLHTHALLVNLSFRADGTTGSLVSKEFFRQKMVAGALYRTELAHQLHERLGLQVENTPDAFNVCGVPEKLCDHFSKRRKEIQAELKRRNLSSAVAAKIAALDTRPSKTHIPRTELFDLWRKVGRGYGWTEREANNLVRQPVKERASAFLHDLPSTLLRLQPELHEPKKLLFVACRIAQERGLSANDALGAVDNFVASRGVLQIRRKNPFWKAPAWSPLRKLKLPYFAFRWQRPVRRFGATIAQANTPAGKLSLRKKFLFPKAPKWNPLRKLSLPALDLYDRAPPPRPKREEKRGVGRSHS